MNSSIKKCIASVSHLENYGELIPVILITVWILYSEKMYTFAITPLGKLVAILLIVYYTKSDILYGLLLCGIILLYYQTYASNGIHMSLFGDFKHAGLNEYSSQSNSIEHFSTIDNDQSIVSCDDKTSSEPKNNTPGSIIDVLQNAEKMFKTNHCKNGILMDKGNPVHLEMVEHVFSDINFKYKRCNPCSDTCEFSLIDAQINAQESLKPTTSDNFLSTQYNTISTAVGKIAEFIPSLWVKSEPFTIL